MMTYEEVKKVLANCKSVELQIQFLENAMNKLLQRGVKAGASSQKYLGLKNTYKENFEKACETWERGLTLLSYADERGRLVCQLHYFECRSLEEIADRLNCSTRTIQRSLDKSIKTIVDGLKLSEEADND